MAQDESEDDDRVWSELIVNQAREILETSRLGYVRAPNDMVANGDPSLFNTRPLELIPAQDLARKLLQDPQRFNSIITYVVDDGALEGKMVANKSELLVEGADDEWTLTVCDGSRVWRVAGNHRVAANAILHQKHLEGVSQLEVRLGAVVEEDARSERANKIRQLLHYRRAQLKNAVWWPAQVYPLCEYMGTLTRTSALG